MSSEVETLKVEKTLTEIGFEKGYLKNLEVFLRPIANKNLTLITKDAKSAHSFMYEGAQLDFCLPQNERLDYFNPFDSVEERKFFEEMLGRELNHANGRHDPNCFWHDNNFKVSITVSSEIKNMGYRMNLRSPEDVLRYKILLKQYDIAPNMESVNDPALNKSHWKWVLASSEYEDTSKSKNADNKVKAYMAFGKMVEHNEKMLDFLHLYFANNKEMKDVSDNTGTTVLKSTIQDIIDTNIDGFIATVNDKDYDTKMLILKGVKAGGVEKQGVNSYSFPGGLKYTFKEFVEYVEACKENQDEDYLKLIARMNMGKTKKPKE